jgi:hypothetical protein
VSRFPGQYDWLVGGAAEIAWCGWVTEGELREALRQWTFVPDGVGVLGCYLARQAPAHQSGRQCSSK